MTARQRRSGRGTAAWADDAPRSIEDIVTNLVFGELAWQNDALCREVDPDLFFGDRGDDSTVADAIKVCEMCPVKAQCLEWALSYSERADMYGVFGGLGSVKRQEIRDTRKAEAA